MDFIRNAVSLPDEVFFALCRFLGLNVGGSTPHPCEEEPQPRPKLYPISDDDSDDDPFPRFPSIPMRRNCQEDARYRCTPNGPTSRQNTPPGAQSRLSPGCSKNKDYTGCNSPQCTNSPPFHQEESPVYLCQDQGFRQQLMHQNRPYQHQSPLNRSQQCPQSSPRSQSLPRANASDRYNPLDKFDCHRGLHTEQELLSPQRGRCELRTPCEGEAPAGNSCLSNCNDRYLSERSSRSNAPCDWNNSSQVGTNYGEWQRRQMQMQLQQKQCQARQQQANQSNISWLQDDEISGFEPDLNSTRIDEDKRCQPLAETSQQQQMPRQYPSCQKTCNSQGQSQRMCRTLEEMSRRPSECEIHPPCQKTCNSQSQSQRVCRNAEEMSRRPSPCEIHPPCQKTCNSQNQSQRICRTAEEMPRRPSQCETPQMARRQTQCDSPTMQRRTCQQYETLLNETSYMQLPEAPRNAKCRPSISQNLCPSAMYQDISPMNQTKQCPQSPRSLSPINGSIFRGQEPPSCEINSPMDMDKTDFYPEDTNCSRSPAYMEMSRALLGRSSLNENSLEKSNQNGFIGGRSTRMHSRTPEELLADRTQAEFLDALVKDRSCPGAIQASLNGTDNFNEFAFDIAFAGPIPAKPFPVDPITMLEAIKLRIDYERGEIRRRVREEDRDQPKDAPHRSLTTEDVDSYFGKNSKSEVNEGVAAFLKAESEYRLTDIEAETAFEAQIQSLETNMFDDQIKLNVYSATTKPAHS